MIRILFNPGQVASPRTREHLRGWINSRDLMDEVRGTISPGIGLPYKKCWDRQKCIRIIEMEERQEINASERLDDKQDIRKIR